MKRILLCVSLLVTSLPLFAQVGLFSNNAWEYGSRFSTDYDTNRCLQFYLEPKDSNKARFKAVRMITYRLKDTAMKRKTFGGKDSAMFNTAGQLVFKMSMDTSRIVQDSDRTVFDSKRRKIRDIKYERDDSLKVMQKTDDEIYTYNAKGQMIKDSEYIYKPFGTFYGRNEDTKFVNEVKLITSYKKWNSKGDEVDYTIITNISNIDGPEEPDTSYGITKFNAKGRMIYKSLKNEWKDLNNKVYYTVCSEYYTYDVKDNEVFYADVRYGDSTYAICNYNNKGILISEMKYRNKELTHSFVMTEGKNGEYTETENMIGNDGPGDYVASYKKSACPNSILTVSVYDSSGHILSEIRTEQKNGEPFVTTTYDRYVFEKGRVVIDSEFTTERSRLHALTSENVNTYKYDAKGNQIEGTVKGGGLYSDNSRTTWAYNEHGKCVNKLDFNACVGDKPQRESVYTYYPDGITVRQEMELETDGTKTITEYLPDARVVSEVCTYKDKTDDKGYELIYTYVK